MHWTSEVEEKLKRKNKVLFGQNNVLFDDLNRLIDQQNHRTLVLWAFTFAEEIATILQARYPEDTRQQHVVATCKKWAEGNVKMREAQRAILAAHAVAKEISSAEDIALCHALGQACAVVHTEGHAMGLPIYELTALVRKYGLPEAIPYIEERNAQYIEKLLYWQTHYDDEPREWASFLSGK